MNKRWTLRCLIEAILLIITVLIWVNFQAQAQTPDPFLTAPYYGILYLSRGFTPGDGNHHGYDVLIGYEEILASDGGSVEEVKWFSDNSTCHRREHISCGYGLYIKIKHSNDYRTIYAHLSTTAYPRGAWLGSVDKGQVIGTSGNTGNSSGPHLHFELRTPGSVATPADTLFEDGWVQCSNPNQPDCTGIENPNRPIPQPFHGDEIIVDDTSDNSAGFSKGWGAPFNNPCTGICEGWWGATHVSAYGSHLYYTLSDEDAIPDEWAKWQPVLPAYARLYQIFVHVPDVHNTTWQAEYKIKDHNNDTIGRGLVDQYGLPDAAYPHSEWVSIGTYYIRNGAYVYVTDANREDPPAPDHCPNDGWCYMAVDAIKFVVLGSNYLPDVRTSVDGRHTYIVVRNNGGGPADVKVTYFEDDGYQPPGIAHHNTIPHYGLYRYETTEDIKSAIVDSDQDISVVVEIRDDNHTNHRAYSGIAPRYADTLIQLSLVHDLPILYRNKWGYSSKISIFNPGSIQTNVTFIPRKQNGDPPSEYCSSTYPYDIPAKGNVELDLYNDPDFACWGAFWGTGEISADEPVAVIVESYKSTGNVSMDYNGPIWGTTDVYLPYLMKAYGGWNSCFVVENTGYQNNTISQKYYADNGTIVIPTPFTLPMNNAKTVCQSEVSGLPNGASSAWVYGTGPIALAVNQDKTAYNQVMSYSGLGEPDDTVKISTTVVLPYMLSNYNYGGKIWNSGLRVQNVGTSSTEILVMIYDSNGNKKSPFPYSLGNVGASKAKSLYLPNLITNSFIGSVVIRATQPIIAVANTSCCNGYVDTSLTYNGINR